MKTFDDSYNDYLQKIGQIDLLDKAKTLNLQIESGKIRIPFFNRCHYISKQGVLGPDGSTPTPAVGTVLLNYVLQNERIHGSTQDKISFRDFEESGPLVISFANNTNRLIEHTFSGRLADLGLACKALSGEPTRNPISADLHVKFEALPNIPLYLSFNDREEDFPAQSNLLFEKSAEEYLDMKSLFVIGTYLAGSLIKF
jgi:hypothetical protein